MSCLHLHFNWLYSLMDREMTDKKSSVTTDETLGYTFQNDFLALSRAFSLPDIDYHDISRREHLVEALKRWPLLADLAEKK